MQKQVSNHKNTSSIHISWQVCGLDVQSICGLKYSLEGKKKIKTSKETKRTWCINAQISLLVVTIKSIMLVYFVSVNVIYCTLAWWTHQVKQINLLLTRAIIFQCAVLNTGMKKIQQQQKKRHLNVSTHTIVNSKLWNKRAIIAITCARHRYIPVTQAYSFTMWMHHNQTSNPYQKLKLLHVFLFLCWV